MIIVSFDTALNFAEEQRPYLPALYNPARENELPIPPVSAQIEDVPANEIVQDNETSQEEDVKPIFENVQLDAADVNAFDALFGNDSYEEQNETINEIDPLANLESASSDLNVDISQIADENETSVDNFIESEATGASNIGEETHNVIESEAAAFDSDMSQVADEYEASADTCIEAGATGASNIGEKTPDVVETEAAASDSDNQKVVKYDHEVEYIFTSLADFRPFTDDYQIKANDVLCQNIPFKQYVSV